MTDTIDTSLAVEATGLYRRFDEVVAVDELDLSVPTGAVYGLLGPDGAGKSTLIKMLATVLRAQAGDALVFGASVCDDPGAVTPRIGYMSQQFSMYPDLTVDENLEFFARLRGVPRTERQRRAPRLLEQMGLDQFHGRLADKLSGGMKQKLMLASTLMHEPDLLLLDEPTTGVDPVSRREFWRIIATLHRTGKTVLVATPYMDEAERCSAVSFMDSGRLRMTGTPAEIKASVPGRLVELAVDDQRAAVAMLELSPRVRAANVLGETVRALVDDEGANPDELADSLEAGGLEVSRSRYIPMDMEAAFAFLSERPGAEAAQEVLDEQFAEAVAPRHSEDDEGSGEGGKSR